MGGPDAPEPRRRAHVKTGTASPLTHPDDALALVLERASPLEPQRVPLADAQGFVLAEDVFADRDYPPFDRAMMDGFGVRLADAGKRARIVGEVTPGTESSRALGDGEAVAIMTGAACPAGVEAVVPIEQVTVDGDHVQLPAEFKARQHIAGRGGERREGEQVLAATSRITPLALAALATVGAHRPLVRPGPRVAAIATGDELVAGEEAPGAACIRDSNRPMLAALLAALGVTDPLLDHAADRPDAVCAALQRASECEIVILTGGVSAGVHDYVYAAAQAEGWEVVFHKVSQKPGKPLLFATRGTRLLFGLPGNPLAVHLCTHRYVAPTVRRMTGAPVAATSHEGRSIESMQNKGPRTNFVLMRATRTDNVWSLAASPCRGSADVLGVVEANAFVRLDPGQTVQPGEPIAFEWLLGARPD